MALKLIAASSSFFSSSGSFSGLVGFAPECQLLRKWWRNAHVFNCRREEWIQQSAGDVETPYFPIAQTTLGHGEQIQQSTDRHGETHIYLLPKPQAGGRNGYSGLQAVMEKLNIFQLPKTIGRGNGYSSLQAVMEKRTYTFSLLLLKTPASFFFSS